MIVAVVGGILLAVLTLYAILAGADFGGGLWDLLGGNAASGRAPRRLIDDTITPVWESNHVWLVFALVIFWTAFPPAFAAVMVAAALPLWLSVLGIVLRGAGFAFRKEVEGLRWQRLLGATFALSSLLTPFFIGTVVGAVVAGKITLSAEHSALTVWTNPTSILTGCLFVVVCAYEAAVFLLGEATTRRDLRLARYFRRRAAIACAAAGVLSLADLLVLQGSDAALADRLTGRALPLIVVAGVCGIVVLALLVAGRTRGLRVLSASGDRGGGVGLGCRPVPDALAQDGPHAIRRLSPPRDARRSHSRRNSRRRGRRTGICPAVLPARSTVAGG